MTSTVENPQYPFIRIGLAFDFDPSLKQTPQDHVIAPEDWWMEIDGVIFGCAYDSRDSTLEAVDENLFAEWHRDIVEKQIKQAIATNNIQLALLLAERKGEANGRVRARAEFAASIVQVERLLYSYKH